MSILPAAIYSFPYTKRIAVFPNKTKQTQMINDAALFNLLTLMNFVFFSSKFSFVIIANEATVPVHIAILTFVALDTSCLAIEYTEICSLVQNSPSINVSISIRTSPPREVRTKGMAYFKIFFCCCRFFIPCSTKSVLYFLRQSMHCILKPPHRQHNIQMQCLSERYL